MVLDVEVHVVADDADGEGRETLLVRDVRDVRVLGHLPEVPHGLRGVVAPHLLLVNDGHAAPVPVEAVDVRPLALEGPVVPVLAGDVDPVPAADVPDLAPDEDDHDIVVLNVATDHEGGLGELEEVAGELRRGLLLAPPE